MNDRRFYPPKGWTPLDKRRILRQALLGFTASEAEADSLIAEYSREFREPAPPTPAPKDPSLTEYLDAKGLQHKTSPVDGGRLAEAEKVVEAYEAGLLAEAVQAERSENLAQARASEIAVLEGEIAELHESLMRVVTSLDPDDQREARGLKRELAAKRAELLEAQS